MIQDGIGRNLGDPSSAGRESEEAIVVLKRGNACGAKGLYIGEAT